MSMPFSSEAGHLRPGHVPAVTKSLPVTGDLPTNTQLNLAVGLPLRNGPALQTLLSEIYNPASPLYHQFLTPDEFAKQFGPSPEQYEAAHIPTGCSSM